MWPVMNWVFSLVEITAFRQESKSCKGFCLQINFPPMRAIKFIIDHVIFKLRYNQIYQLKTTIVTCSVFLDSEWITDNVIVLYSKNRLNTILFSSWLPLLPKQFTFWYELSTWLLLSCHLFSVHSKWMNVLCPPVF